MSRIWGELVQLRRGPHQNLHAASGWRFEWITSPKWEVCGTPANAEVEVDKRLIAGRYLDSSLRWDDDDLDVW